MSRCRHHEPDQFCADCNLADEPVEVQQAALRWELDRIAELRSLLGASIVKSHPNAPCADLDCTVCRRES